MYLIQLLVTGKSDSWMEFPGYPISLSAPVPDLSAPVDHGLLHEFPAELIQLVKQSGRRASNKDEVGIVIHAVCSFKNLKISDLSSILGRSDKYLLREFITPMREAGKLAYAISDMPNHPEQAYRAISIE